MKLYLASRSPRRIEMLTALGADLTIVPADIDEEAYSADSPASLVRILAQAKAMAAMTDGKIGTDAPVLAADTVVDLDGAVLGKPKDRIDAERMVRALSGRSHLVHTGIALSYQGKTVSDTVTTAVHFRSLTDHEIAAYVASGECDDKAGAYGIQGKASLFVTGIEGDYHSVVGLPVCRVQELLTQIGATSLLG